MTHSLVKEHLAFLVENINSPYDHLLLLRGSLEASLFKLGHNKNEINAALTEFYTQGRTLH